MNEQPALRWSGSFGVLPATATSVKNLSGDKIILPQSALEQLLNAAPSQPTAASSFTAWDPHNPYRSNGFGFEQRQQLPQPLTFRLVNSQNGNVVFAGIREFSAEEGTVGLSSFLIEALGIEPQQLNATNGNGTSDADAIDLTGDHVPSTTSSVKLTVDATNIPKGTYVRLRPLEAGYNPDDWKSLLERHLREHYTCLTKNSILSVNGVKGETFKFLVDRLSPEGDGICVVDTDLEVDIEALNEEQARETMRQIMTKAQTEIVGGVSKGGDLDIWKDVSGNVSPGGYVDYILPSWDRSQPLTITLSGIEQEYSVDLFVTPKSSRQRVLPRDSAHVFGDFSPAENGVKSITISPTNVEMEGAEAILVSVHGFSSENQRTSQPIPFTVRAKVGSPTSKAGQDRMEVDGEEHSSDEEQCSNCKQWVPKRTMVLHENFCRRNNIPCPYCSAVFKKDSNEWHSHWHCEHDSAKGNSAASKSKHDMIFHQHHPCQDCEFTTNSLADLARHRTSVCPGKLILCRFCHLEVPQEGDPFNPSPEVVLSGLTAHELADGARTTECHLCDKIVRLRDMETHMKHHELDKVSRAKPEICRNVNCGRTLHGVGPRGQIGAGTSQGQGPGNDIGLCSLCFGPLYVSMHDPEGKALRRRIERKYLGQMMTGCGKSHCANEWCRTGRKNTNAEAKGSSASAVLPLVKPLLAMVGTPDGHMYFCVDETNQKRRKIAEMLAAEKVWDLEWCVAAAEAEKGNIDRMRDWLQAWAPRS
ncbi:Ubiquitin fusion degradation protein UFD1, partial [Metarhizium majus ARSEF 297]